MSLTHESSRTCRGTGASGMRQSGHKPQMAEIEAMRRTPCSATGQCPCSPLARRDEGSQLAASRDLMNSTDFIFGDLLSSHEFDSAQYRLIDTIRYEHEINAISHDMADRVGMDYISCCLKLPSGERFVISNNPGKIAIPYYVHGLNRIDNIFCPERYKDHSTGCFIPSQVSNDRLGEIFENVLSDKFGVRNVVGFFRHFQGYQIIVIFGKGRDEVSHHLRPPKEADIYEYSLFFLKNLISLYVQDKPSLKFSRFHQDDSFVRKLITQALQDRCSKLSERELYCLFWARMGKTIEDVAIILGIGKGTVRRHFESIREKLDVGSIHEAIVLATHLNLIN
jgi:DNA-binding CsgD family transcriptional regulator